MYNCEIEIANLSVNWKFPFIVSQLPTPTTDAFSYLVRKLQPFGLIARNVNLESNGSNLDDVALVINLLNYKLLVRLTYSGIDVEGRNIEPEEVIPILEILGIVFDSLKKIEPEVNQGNGVVKISLHLSLQEGTGSQYIAERVSAKFDPYSADPDAIVFNYVFDEVSKLFPTKITIAKSLAFPEGLFLEISYSTDGEELEYKESAPPEEFFQLLSEHYKKLLSSLGLNIVTEGNENATN